MSRTLYQGRFVGATEAVGSGFVEGFLQHAVSETLRSLRHHYPLPRQRSDNNRALSGTLHLFDSIYGGKSSNGSPIFLCGRDDAADDFLSYKGPNRVVHQNDVV